MRPATIILFAILLLSFSYAATFGYSRLTIERTWTIEDPKNGTFEFNGTLAVNNSNQQVVFVSTEPVMDQYMADDGTIRLHYRGKVEGGMAVLKAKAIVNVDYNTDMLSDAPLPDRQLNYTPLTEPDTAISLQAWGLANGNSSLATIRDLVNWVHTNLTYDIAYWSKSKSARDVFAERRGVCVEYTHLLISMARSLGFDTRYVSGYVESEVWQPHAWAEIYLPGYGWLPADATFGQAGILDSSHLAIHYGQDQSDVYDLLTAQNQDTSIEVSDDLDASFSSEDNKGVSIAMLADQDSYVADVTLSNSRPDYLLGTFVFTLPDGYGGSQASVVLLRPNETAHTFRGLNHSLIQDGYVYDIPISASFNDAKVSTVLSVRPGSGWEGQTGETTVPASPCPAALLLALVPAAVLLRRLS